MPVVLPLATAALMTETFAALSHQPVEVCAILYLDAERRLVGARHIAGSAATVALTTRTVVADALAFGAARVVMAHNHPSGDPSPSAGDLAFTRELVRGLDTLDVRLDEHVVLAPAGVTALRARGLV